MHELKLAEEVGEALAEGRAVVALETTIVTHGMPYPENVATALAGAGDGQGRGAGDDRGDRRCDSGRPLARRNWSGWLAQERLKLSRNDLAYALAAGKHGATTVAATMICAHLAGIRVFATGGIGGVHRGAEKSFDISADLEELARTPVAVVCAGAKALLDLPKTLEYLETRGVPVIGYRTEEFPAFWSRSSGLAAPMRADSPGDVARLLRTHWWLGMGGGAMMATRWQRPMRYRLAEMAGYSAAVAEAAMCGVAGKKVTPYILSGWWR